MSDAYLGEIRIVGFTYAPKGWALCNGQLLSRSQNPGLFQIVGTTYGGDGVNDFAIPDMRERIPIHAGAGQGLTPRAVGESGGQSSVVLTSDQIGHSHPLVAVSDPATATDPNAQTIAQAGSKMGNIYHAATNMVAMNGGSITSSGGVAQSHENRPAHLAVTFIICLQGVFPPRS